MQLEKGSFLYELTLFTSVIFKQVDTFAQASLKHARSLSRNKNGTQACKVRTNPKLVLKSTHKRRVDFKKYAYIGAYANNKSRIKQNRKKL